MEVIGLVASISQLIEATIKTIKYLNTVRGASEDRSRLFWEVSSLVPLLGDLRNQVEQESNRAAWFDCVRSLAVRNGPIDQLREAFQQLTDRLKPKKGLRNVTHAFTWTFDRAYCEEILRKIERVKSRISLALQGDILTLAGIIKADTAQIAIVDEHISTIARDIDKQKTEEDLKRRQQILEWLSPLNFFKTQQDTFARQEKGTGQWLLDLPSFQNWLSGTDRTLCCPGIPGAGKSVLASVVVDFLRTLHMKHDSVGIAAVYCNFKERDQQSPENLLAGCCAQLIQHSEKPLSEVLIDMYNRHKSQGTRPEWEDIVGVYRGSIANLNTVYLVVDALDECSEDARNVLLKNFKALPANARLLVTTRHIDEITREFHDSPKIEIRADPSDLKRYIRSRIASNRRLEGYVRNDSSLEPHICDRVTGKADGMFLAAKLHVNAISTKTSVKMLKRAIENLSDDLNVLYNDALSRIESQNEDDQKLAKKALRWVAYTYKPLSPNALREALAIEPGETDFDNEALSLIGMILDVCAGLLILDEENDIVRLVHYTAQDYFDAVQISRFHKVHATIASDCINYLSYDCFQCPEGPSHHIIEATPGMPRDSTSAPPTYFYFLEYASVFWVKHAMANRDSKLSVRIHKFLAGNPRIILDKVVRSYGRMTTDRLRTRHGLEIAVFFGLCDYLEGLFKDIGEAHLLLDGLFLLHLAARDDQVTAVEVLVDHGANKERRDPDGLTPLHCAIERDALKAATALVNRGADVMAVASDGLTPIASVRAISPASFLELLLKAGVKIRTRDISDETPLMRQLIKTDDVNTAKRLFEQHSLNEPTEKPLFSKALLLASHLGSMGIIDMLLDYGADINSKDQSDQTALHLASSKSELACIKLLLARGADTEAQDKCGRTSLFHAAEWGHEDCLFTFLCNGANVNAQDDFGTTALLMASKNGRLVALKLLLAHGANTEARDTLGRTSLFYAAREGNEECLLALLRNGADVNAQDDFGTTALHMASKNGELIAVELLLEHGANPEAQDDKGRTSLFYAAQKGDEDSLLVLLRNGADVNVQDEHGMTALHMTSAQGNLTMTQELVEHHATIVIRSRSVLTKYLRSARSWQDRPFGIHCFDVKDDLWAQITCLGPPDLRDLKGIISERKELLELRVWKDGVTALDIATFCGRDKIVRLLNSSAESATESHPVSFEDYLFDLLGISSVEEAEEELDRRIEKENKGGWRKVQWGFPKGRN